MYRRMIAVALVAVAVLAGVQVPSALAGPTGCMPSLGQRQPVVMVHGFLGSPHAWDSLMADVRKIPHVYAETFDYQSSHTKWVDDPNIGPKLAQRIACLAASSRAAGGPGKVDVVGHSMGGLATRFASAVKLNGRRVSDDIGLLVTIATPNTGSGWANSAQTFLKDLCTPASIAMASTDNPCGMKVMGGLSDDSPQIKNLPWLPSNIPLKAIAGNVGLDYTFFGRVVLRVPTGGDLVVSKKSALHGMSHADQGGGQDVVSCGMDVARADMFAPVLLNIPTQFPNCWHSALTHNTQVKDDVVRSIRDTLTQQVTFHGLTLNVPQSWNVRKNPDSVDEVGVATSCRPLTYFFSTPCPVFWVVGPGELDTQKALGYGNPPESSYVPAGDVQPCRGMNATPNNPKQLWITTNHPGARVSGTRPVGSHQANYHEWSFQCGTLDQNLNGVFHVVPGHDFTERTWWLPQSNLLVVTLWNIPGLDDILSRATWS